MSDQTRSGMSVSEDSRIKMPLKTLAAVLGFVALAAVSWASIKYDVLTNAKEVQLLKADVKEVQMEQRTQRELLIRIDSKLDRAAK